MQFTRYIPTSINGSIADPLEFLRPSAALADLLFPQFTVLSNHPCYLGFLCFTFMHLEQDSGLTVRDRRFSAAFREIEVLWGILCLYAQDKVGTDGPSILNVNRLRKAKREEGCGFSSKNDPYGFFSRLGYGTLGHYHGPAVLWRLLGACRRTFSFKVNCSSAQVEYRIGQGGRYGCDLSLI